VEPRVEFWRRLEQMATRTANFIQGLPYQGVVSYQDGFGSRDLATIQTNQVTFLTSFAARVAQLREIAEQELRHEPLTAAQLQFIDGLMQAPAAYYSPVRDYGGWYPGLFYRNVFGRGGKLPDTYSENYGVKRFDALVADVHTDSSDPFGSGDPGSVLHQGVGHVHLLFVAVDSGTNRTIYAGPVLSHYEFETPFPRRQTDVEWQNDLLSGRAPPHPEWTQSFLVPAE
jgi:hypothetical protein